MTKFAKGTEVPIEKTEAEIRGVLRKYGADGFAIGEFNGLAQLAFQMQGRRIVMRMPLPDRKDKAFWTRHPNSRTRKSLAEQAGERWEQACREKWRALLLCIRAKLESVESGIETFDQAFLAHVMLPTGETVGEWAGRPETLQAALDGRPMPPLLPGAPQ